MKETKARKRVLFGKYAWAAACVLTAVAYGQATPPNGGVLMPPQAPTLLQRPALGVSACSVGMLDLRITTGNDDLRGGNDNLNVEIHYANGDMQTAANVNKGANWSNQSVNMVAINLTHPVAPGEIKQLRLVHSAQAGYIPPSSRQIAGSATPAGPLLAPISAAQGIQSEDNWDMAELQAFALGKGINVPLASSGFHRFTGSNPSLDINAHPAAGCPTGHQVTRISFTFKTADDDLRGGNDNLNIRVLFADGTSQSEPNVNHNQNWPNGSTKDAEILLDRLVDMSQIRGFTLEDTFAGGSGGDNWNMASMQADASLADGTKHTIGKFGFHRFSSDQSGPKARQITVPSQPIN